MNAVGVSVEGELGCLGSLESGTAGEEDGSGAEGTLARDQMLTEPEQAADLSPGPASMRWRSRSVPRTAPISSCASRPAISWRSSASGISIAASRTPIWCCTARHRCRRNGLRSFANGGELKETYGVPVEEIQEGIRYGVRKLNIDTDIRLSMTGAMRRAMTKDRSESDPRKFFKERCWPPGPCAPSVSPAAPARRRRSSQCRWTRWLSGIAARSRHQLRLDFPQHALRTHAT